MNSIGFKPLAAALYIGMDLEFSAFLPCQGPLVQHFFIFCVLQPLNFLIATSSLLFGKKEYTTSIIKMQVKKFHSENLR